MRKNSQKIEKTLSQGNKGRHLQESNRGGSLSRMDTSNRCHVTRMNNFPFKYHVGDYNERERERRWTLCRNA